MEIANSDEVNDKESEGSTSKIGGDATSTTPVSNGIISFLHLCKSILETFYQAVYINLVSSVFACFLVFPSYA